MAEQVIDAITGQTVNRSDCREVWFFGGNVLPTNPTTFDDVFLLTTTWQNYPTWRLRENVEIVRQKQIENLDRVD